MVANDPHNRKPPLLLGFIAMVSGILLALFLLDKVHAADLNPANFNNASFLINDASDSRAIYGWYDSNLYIIEGNRLSRSTEDYQFDYDYWYSNHYLGLSNLWGFSGYENEVILGNVINTLNSNGYIIISQYNTIQNIQLKEFVSDENIEVTYFEDDSGVKWAYVSYVSNNADYPFNEFTVNKYHHFVEYDAIYREFYRWDLDSSSWIHQTVTNEQVYVDTILKAAYSIRLTPEASVKIKNSRFLIDDPVPTSSPTPTPTQDPSVPSNFGFIGYYSYGSTYYYVEISGDNLFKSVELDIYNDDVAAAMSELGISDPNTIQGKSAYLLNTFSTGSSINWSGPNAYLYFTGDNLTVKIWRMSSSLISEDVNYIKQNYSYVTLDGSNINNSGFPYFTLYSVNELKCLLINCDYYRNTGTYSIVNTYGNNIDILESYSSIYRGYNSSEQLRKAYKALLTRTEAPSPTPDPNASPTPEPTATPTPPPYVIIITPDPSPTPTPPFVIPTMPPWNPPGNQLIPLDPDIQNDVFGEFNFRLGDNNAFGLFGLLISLLPGDLMWYLWFLLFILLVVGVAKLIIHFTGG